MKINLAVYTAQEGYSWQPGTALDAETLRAYKSRIGKFPSPDASDFPFGGAFLEGDAVVFYRYHVAKKIDFRGRDALYCVLGVVPKEWAATVDPKALFALPQFAAPVQPFPTEAELPVAEAGSVPSWLKNLADHTLDVRISGTGERADFNVKQERIEVPESPPRPLAGAGETGVPIVRPSMDVRTAPSDATDDRPVVSPIRSPVSLPAPVPHCKKLFVLLTGLVAVVAIAALFALVMMISSCSDSGKSNGGETASVEPVTGVKQACVSNDVTGAKATVCSPSNTERKVSATEPESSPTAPAGVGKGEK